MGRPKKEEIQGEKTQGEASKKVLGSLMRVHKDNHYNDINEKPIKFSSGSLILDTILCSNGSSGLKSSQVALIGGAFGGGKTSQAFLMISNYMKEIPNSKCIYVKAEGRLSEELKERTGLEFTLNPDDWKTGTVFILETNQFEVMAEILENLLKTMYQNGERLCCIIDSLDGLILSNDLNSKNITESTIVAGVPKITKLFFRRMALPIGKYNAFFAILSQLSSHIKINPYERGPQRAMSSVGGNSVNHASDLVLEIQNRSSSDLILENPKEKPSMANKVLGHEVIWKIIKSPNETESMICKVPIKRGRVGNGVWVEKEVIDIALSAEMLKKTGAWFNFDKAIISEAAKDSVIIKEQLHGLDAAYSYIEENKDVFDWLLAKIKRVFIR